MHTSRHHHTAHTSWNRNPDLASQPNQTANLPNSDMPNKTMPTCQLSDNLSQLRHLALNANYSEPSTHPCALIISTKLFLHRPEHDDFVSIIATVLSAATHAWWLCVYHVSCTIRSHRAIGPPWQQKQLSPKMRSLEARPAQEQLEPTLPASLYQDFTILLLHSSSLTKSKSYVELVSGELLRSRRIHITYIYG